MTSEVQGGSATSVRPWGKVSPGISQRPRSRRAPRMTSRPTSLLNTSTCRRSRLRRPWRNASPLSSASVVEQAWCDGRIGRFGRAPVFAITRMGHKCDLHICCSSKAFRRPGRSRSRSIGNTGPERAGLRRLRTVTGSSPNLAVDHSYLLSQSTLRRRSTRTAAITPSGRVAGNCARRPSRIRRRSTLLSLRWRYGLFA